MIVLKKLYHKTSSIDMREARSMHDVSQHVEELKRRCRPPKNAVDIYSEIREDQLNRSIVMTVEYRLPIRKGPMIPSFNRERRFYRC